MSSEHPHVENVEAEEVRPPPERITMFCTSRSQRRLVPPGKYKDLCQEQLRREGVQGSLVLVEACLVAGSAWYSLKNGVHAAIQRKTAKVEFHTPVDFLQIVRGAHKSGYQCEWIPFEDFRNYKDVAEKTLRRQGSIRSAGFNLHRHARRIRAVEGSPSSAYEHLRRNLQPSFSSGA